MMPVWQLVDGMHGKTPAYVAQCIRKDGHRANLFAAEDGLWSAYDLCEPTKPVASGKAASLDHAQLLARLVWELSA